MRPSQLDNVRLSWHAFLGWQIRRCLWIAVAVAEIFGQGWPLVLGLPDFSSSAKCQERTLSSTAHGATAQERLLMEQIDQLADAGQYREALQILDRLIDNAEGRVTELGPVQQASTLSTQVFGPIAKWGHLRVHRWLEAAPDAVTAALSSQRPEAEGALRRGVAERSWRELQKSVDRYTLVDSSFPARLVLSDLYLDRGWTIAARQVLEAPGFSLRLTVPHGETVQGGAGSSLPWTMAWPLLRESEHLDRWLQETLLAVRPNEGMESSKLASELVARFVTISALDCQAEEFQECCEWALALAQAMPPEFKQQTAARVQAAQGWFQQRQLQQQNSIHAGWLTFAGDMARSGEVVNEVVEGSLEMGTWPAWSRPLERVTGSLDRNPASKPPVAETTMGLVAYHPVIHDGKVFVNELIRISAFHLDDGRPWPSKQSALPLYDSGISAANYFPYGYAVIGLPRGTLCVADDVLYARMGPPVTGWLGGIPGRVDGSLSSIVALDLGKQGSLCPGFPVRLLKQDFPEGEFEGCPLVLGDKLIVAVSMRDNASLRRLLVALDRESGLVRWRSPVLSSGSVSGSEQASLIAHQLVSAAGGRIFYNTNLGAIVCLDAETGRIVWCTRYRRSLPAVDAAYALPDRYRYRDLVPCLLAGTQVICAPQDCPEVFALDCVTGDCLWSTDGERVDDATQLLGVQGQSILCAGDRLYWLERTTGRLIAAFPSGTTSDVVGSLPAPRGYGRGLVHQSRVYWPTQHEVLVFEADQAGRAVNGVPAIVQRIRLDTRGAEAGNLVFSDQGLVIAGASRMFNFRWR